MTKPTPTDALQSIIEWTGPSADELPNDSAARLEWYARRMLLIRNAARAAIMEAAPTNAYATDGKCHNAEAGTYGHECGKPATWLGTDRNGFASGFCSDCKEHGREARGNVKWTPLAAIKPAEPTLNF
jgi:hypothetical protein